MIDKYTAKDVKTGEIVEGYYAEYKEYVDAPECEDGMRAVHTKHVLLVEGKTVPNKLIEHEIDMSTLASVNIVAEKVMTKDDVKQALASRGFATTDRNVNSVLSTRALTFLNGYNKDEYQRIHHAIDMCKGLRKHAEGIMFTSHNEELKEGTTVTLRVERTDDKRLTGWFEHSDVSTPFVFVGEALKGEVPEEEVFYNARFSLTEGDIKGICFERTDEKENERCYLTITGKAEELLSA
jgi:hypothetical protein